MDIISLINSPLLNNQINREKDTHTNTQIYKGLLCKTALFWWSNYAPQGFLVVQRAVHDNMTLKLVHDIYFLYSGLFFFFCVFVSRCVLLADNKHMESRIKTITELMKVQKSQCLTPVSTTKEQLTLHSG